MQEDAFQLLFSMSMEIAKECKELYALAIEQTQASEEDIISIFCIIFNFDIPHIFFLGSSQ